MANFTCRETTELILRLIASGEIDRAAYINSLRSETIVVDIKDDSNNEPPIKNPYQDAYWSDAKREFIIIVPED